MTTDFNTIFHDVKNDFAGKTTAAISAWNAGGDNQAEYRAWHAAEIVSYQQLMARCRELLDNKPMDDALTQFERHMPNEPVALAEALAALDVKIGENEKILKENAAAFDRQRSRLGAIVFAENMMQGFPAVLLDESKAAQKDLNDTSLIGSIDRVRRSHVSRFARAKDQALRQIERLEQKAAKEQLSAREQFNMVLERGFAVAAPVPAPQTASFTRKPKAG
ncbi:MAG TPA: hypothetical protein VEF76_00840 [Patescibacteria group bacterium]|nr:hypothetical protein [Patescibacteria group bacterium]